MSEGDFNRAMRHHNKKRKLTAKQCQQCGNDDIRALQVVTQVTLCAECRLKLQGKRPVEDHHPLGRRNDPGTVSIPANDHAALSDMRLDWPEDLPDDHPLSVIVIGLLAIRDLFLYFADRILGWAELLIQWIRDDQSGRESWATGQAAP